MGFSPRAPRLRVNLYTEGLPAQKTFGETFGAATGVSDPRLQKKSGNWES